jgi:Cu-Zn family superoxide dismutase
MARFIRFAAAAMLAAGLGACASAERGGVAVAMHTVSATGDGATIGEIVLRDGPHGVVLQTHLQGLPPGDHGMHLHTAASCERTVSAEGQVTPAGAAGAHFDPANTGHHEGPTGAGHLGDLPLIHVGADGVSNQTLTAPRLHSVADLRGHAIIIHANGDNYSDTPAPLGGGGGRIACGVVG